MTNPHTEGQRLLRFFDRIVALCDAGVDVLTAVRQAVAEYDDDEASEERAA